MASWQENNRRVEGVHLSEKASGLGVEEGVGARRRAEQKRGEHRRGNGRELRGTAVVVDILLILLVAAVVVGGYFTYRAIKKAYQPTYETRKIEMEIALVDVDRTLAEELRIGMQGDDIWYTDRTDGVCLGRIDEVRVAESASSLNNSNGISPDKVDIYLLVRADAQLRTGKGYYVSDVRILAGESSVFRVKGLVSEGYFVSVVDTTKEISDASSETGTGAATDEKAAPEAAAPRA